MALHFGRLPHGRRGLKSPLELWETRQSFRRLPHGRRGLKLLTTPKGQKETIVAFLTEGGD